MPNERPKGPPEFGPVTIRTIGAALRLSLEDMRRAKGFGVLFTLPYIIGGWFFAWVTWLTGESYWLIFAAVGFPLFGPFASIGLYEVSRRLENGLPMDRRAILGVVSRQITGQLPWLSAVIIMIVMFWFFLGHMIFALFLGLSAMTNITSSFDVYFTTEGLQMLAVGSAVGAVFAFIVFAISVFGIPMLLERKVDFVTAMLVSFKTVQDNWLACLIWAACIVVSLGVAMLPGFLGLFFVMPLLGHASWHLYDQAKT